MDKDLISVVVPIYNVERYLDKCVDSIIRQSYRQLEIILVDDGSSDGSAAICDEWKEKDARVRVLHKENGGLSDARNIGIECATGRYICFVDSDDYLDRHFVKTLYSMSQNSGANVSQCGINYVDDCNSLIKSISHKNDCVKPGREIVIESLNEYYVENEVVWNKLYKADIFDRIRFPKGRIHEDEYVTYKILYHESRVAVTKKALYNYRQSESSIMHSDYSAKKYKDFLDAYIEKMHFFHGRDDIIYDMTIRSYLSNLSNIYVKLKRNKEKDSGVILKDIKSRYRKWYKYIMSSPNINMKNKIKVSLFYFSPCFYGFLKWIKKER